MIDGILDLSHHNTVDLATLAQNGILGVIHKCTQGTTLADSMFEQRKDAASSLGMLFGSYHFGTGAASGSDQAAYFLQHAKGLLVLDFEANTSGASMAAVQASAFVKAVFDATGIYPGVYTDGSHVQALADMPDIASNCWLWIAEYHTDASVTSPRNAVANTWPWSMWQWTDGSLRNHPDKYINGVDADRFNGSVDDLNAFWAKNSI
jgi:lysozyme